MGNSQPFPITRPYCLCHDPIAMFRYSSSTTMRIQAVVVALCMLCHAFSSLCGHGPLPPSLWLNALAAVATASRPTITSQMLRPPALSAWKQNWVLSPRRYAQKRHSTAATKQAVNNDWYDQRRTTLCTLQPPDRQQFPPSHRPPTALLNRRRCYGRHISMQIAGVPILSQPHTKANMEGRCWSEEKSGNHRHAYRMRLRYSSCPPTSDQCRPPIAIPPNSQ